MRDAVAAPPATPPQPALAGLRRRWTVALVAGELVGFIPPAVTGTLLGRAGAADPVLVAGLVLAGSLEGAALGFAQATVLRRPLPALRGRDWVLATAAGAALAWLAGMSASPLIERFGPAALVVVAPALLAGLLAMGTLQWLLLRRHVPRSGRWVWVSGGAWLVGVMLPVAAISLTPDAWPVAAHVVAGVVGAVAMGVTVGLLTGGTLVALLRRAAVPEASD